MATAKAVPYVRFRYGFLGPAFDVVMQKLSKEHAAERRFSQKMKLVNFKSLLVSACNFSDVVLVANLVAS